MLLSVRGLTFTAGVVWAVTLLFVGLIHLTHPHYGTAFLAFMSSVYPGFHGASNVNDVLVGVGYAFLDGAIAGLGFAWLHNAFVSACGSGAKKGAAAS